MTAPISTLSLQGLGDIALTIAAIAGVVALLFAYAEVRISRANARRARVYDYADRFNQLEILRARAHFESFWEKNSFKDYKRQDTVKQQEGRMLPNLIEELLRGD